MSVLVTSSKLIMNVREPAWRNGSSLASTTWRSLGQEKQRSRLGGLEGAAGVGISGSAGLRLGIHSTPCARARRISAAKAAWSAGGYGSRQFVRW